MKSIQDWDKVRQEFTDCQKSNRGVVFFATADEAGTPNITPIGSLFLGEDCSGVFCNHFPVTLNRNIEENNRVCVIALNNSNGTWLKALFKGRFSKCPGIKLYGRISPKRELTPKEQSRWQQVIRPMRFFKGYDLIWKDIRQGSDIVFDAFEYLKLGQMRVA